MNTRLASRTLAIALFCSPFAIQSCYAARIYNNLDSAIFVQGAQVLTPVIVFQGGDSVQLAPHQRSDSLQWTADTGVIVSRDAKGSQNLCNVGFGPHAQIQGGNYMVVSPPQNGVSCAVYDSNHHLIASGG